MCVMPKELEAFKPGMQIKLKSQNLFHHIPAGTVVTVISVGLGCDYQMIIRDGKRADGSHVDDWTILVYVSLDREFGYWAHPKDVEIVPDVPFKMDVVEKWNKPRTQPITGYERIGQGIFNTQGVKQE